MNIRALSSKKTTLAAATLALGGLALAACGSSSGPSIQSVVKGATTAPAYRSALPAPVAEERIERELAAAPAGRCAPQQVVPTLLTYAPAGTGATTCTAGVAERLARLAEQEAYEAGVPQATVQAEDAWLERFVAPGELAAAEQQAKGLVGERTKLTPFRLQAAVVVPLAGSSSAVVAWCGSGGTQAVDEAGQTSGVGNPTGAPGEAYAVLVNRKVTYFDVTSTCVLAAKGAA